MTVSIEQVEKAVAAADAALENAASQYSRSPNALVSRDALATLRTVAQAVLDQAAKRKKGKLN